MINTWSLPPKTHIEIYAVHRLDSNPSFLLIFNLYTNWVTTIACTTQQRNKLLTICKAFYRKFQSLSPSGTVKPFQENVILQVADTLGSHDTRFSTRSFSVSSIENETNHIITLSSTSSTAIPRSDRSNVSLLSVSTKVEDWDTKNNAMYHYRLKNLINDDSRNYKYISTAAVDGIGPGLFTSRV